MATVTADAITDLPCPRAGVTVQGLTPGEHVINLWRITDGVRAFVRGGKRIDLVDSAYLEDYEVPFNREVRYEVDILSGPDAGLSGLITSVTVPSDCGYIQDPLNPSSAVPVYGVREGGAAYLRSASFARFAYEAQSSKFQVMGSRLPVSISGTRQAPSGIPIAMTTRAEAENSALRSLVSDCTHLVIRGLPEWGDYIPGTATYEAASIEEIPIDVAMGGSMTRWETTADQVRSTSKSIVVALWTYQDVQEIFSGTTYDSKQAAVAGGSYLQDQKNPTNS